MIGKYLRKKKKHEIEKVCKKYKKEKIYPAYVSEHNSNREKQVILWSIPNREKQEANSEGQNGIILQ